MEQSQCYISPFTIEKKVWVIYGTRGVGHGLNISVIVIERDLFTNLGYNNGDKMIKMTVIKVLK